MLIPAKWIFVRNWWWVKLSNNRCLASWVRTEGSDKGSDSGAYYLRPRTIIRRDLELTTPRFLSAHLTSRDCETGHSQWTHHNLIDAVPHLINLSSDQTPGYLLYLKELYYPVIYIYIGSISHYTDPYEPISMIRMSCQVFFPETPCFWDRSCISISPSGSLNGSSTLWSLMHLWVKFHQSWWEKCVGV